jgi:hypothetical protein
MNYGKRAKPDAKSGRDDLGGTIDASPESQGQELNQALRSVQDTKVWKDSTSGIKTLWGNYLQTLSNSFKRMSREQQESLISRICIIMTMGVSIILINLFYSFFPPLVRALVPPLVLALAYFAGARVVAPVMIGRFEEHLNREF